MNTKTVKLKITKQDWENFSMYCIITNIDKSKALTMITDMWLDKHDVDIINIDTNVIVGLNQYNPKKAKNLKYNHNYLKEIINVTVRIEENTWKIYSDFCEKNNMIKSGLLNVIINNFLYEDFPCVCEEIKETEPIIKFINEEPWLLELNDKNYLIYDIYNKKKDEWTKSSKIILKKQNDKTYLKKQHGNFKYVYYPDGTLKFKVNKNIKGNQA